MTPAHTLARSIRFTMSLKSNGVDLFKRYGIEPKVNRNIWHKAFLCPVLHLLRQQLNARIIIGSDKPPETPVGFQYISQRMRIIGTIKIVYHIIRTHD